MLEHRGPSDTQSLDRHPPQHEAAPERPGLSETLALDRHGFKCACACLLGVKPSQAYWQLLPKLGDERVGFGAFRDAMLTALAGRHRSDTTRQVFAAFDLCCQGFICRADAHAAFASAAPSVPRRVVDEVFDELDMDRDGRVGFIEFAAMMRAQP